MGIIILLNNFFFECTANLPPLTVTNGGEKIILRFMLNSLFSSHWKNLVKLMKKSSVPFCRFFFLILHFLLFRLLPNLRVKWKWILHFVNVCIRCIYYQSGMKKIYRHNVLKIQLPQFMRLKNDSIVVNFHIHSVTKKKKIEIVTLK